MIRLKAGHDLKFLRASGKILAKVLGELKVAAREGVSLNDLDRRAREVIEAAGAKSAFLGYRPAGAKKKYPAAICTSVNDQIVHGIPSDYALRKGDILKIDAGVNYEGYFTDAAITLGIGEIGSADEKLISVTKLALEKAIGFAVAGKRLGDIGASIEKTARVAGFSVVRGLTGHGVGFELHEEPIVYNFGNAGEGLKIQSGLVLAIEPMFAAGSEDIFEAGDGSFSTKDGSMTAHFEHTVYIGEEETEILTDEAPFLYH